MSRPWFRPEHERQQRNRDRPIEATSLTLTARALFDIGRRKSSIEVHPLDQRIGRQDLQRAPIRHRYRGIVADPHEQGRIGAGYARPNPLDQGPFAGIGDPLSEYATGQTQRLASP